MSSEAIETRLSEYAAERDLLLQLLSEDRITGAEFDTRAQALIERFMEEVGE